MSGMCMFHSFVAYIYITKVESNKSSLVQKTRLTLLLSKEPLQNLENAVLVTLIQLFPAMN